VSSLLPGSVFVVFGVRDRDWGRAKTLSLLFITKHKERMIART
jgi:hypothetical protein